MKLTPEEIFRKEQKELFTFKSSKKIKIIRPATPKQINARKVNWYRFQLKGIIRQLKLINNEINTRDHIEILYFIERLNSIIDYRIDEYNHRIKRNLEAIETKLSRPA